MGMGLSLTASPLMARLDLIDANSMSGFWRMMEGLPMVNGFPVTQHEYNIYEDRCIDWLHRYGFSWYDNENIRAKCESWIKNTPDIIQ